jgi:hypothetical protein
LAPRVANISHGEEKFPSAEKEIQTTTGFLTGVHCADSERSGDFYFAATRTFPRCETS